MSRHEAARLRQDADLAVKRHSEALARRRQAEIDEESTRKEMYRARELAAQAEAAARKSPGGIFGEPSTLGVEILAGMHGQSSDVITLVAMSSTWWQQAWDFFSVGPLLRICRSPLWRAAVLAATQAHVRPETLVRCHIGQLVGLMRLGSAQQACWAIQKLIYSHQCTLPRSSFNTRTTYRVYEYEYGLMQHAFNAAHGVAPLWKWLRAAVEDKSLQSAAGLRYAAARLLLLLIVTEDADKRDEIISMGGDGAVKLVNEHGRWIDLPLPPPLARPDTHEMLPFGEDRHISELLYPTMRLSAHEVFGLPDDARMYVYLNGEPVNKNQNPQGPMAIQCAVEWTPDLADDDFRTELAGWRVKLPSDEKCKALSFARRSGRLRKAE